MDRQLERSVLAVALVVLVYGAAGGPGWNAASGDALLAVGLERAASAPLYGLVASVAARLPIGEPGFRLAVVNAVLGAIVVVGVLRAVRALLPKDPIAGVIAATIALLAPPVRDAAGVAGPAMLAACGTVWAFALASAHARTPSRRTACGALAWAAVAIGSAPWLGAAVVMLVVAWLWRTTDKQLIAISLGVIGLVVVAWWFDPLGALPAAAPNLEAVVATSGRGAAAVVVGAGLLGTAFAAITGLPSAGWLAATTAVVAGHTLVFDHDPTALLVVLAIGSAVLPGAVVRVVSSRHRHLVALAAGLPLVAVAVVAGPAVGVDDPGAAPARLATDVIGEVPAGPGVIVATDRTAWTAIEYAQTIAGERPDLTLVPQVPAAANDQQFRVLRNILITALRADRLATADPAGFVFLDPQWAIPRGRGFEILGRPPRALPIVPPPATYASAVGDVQAVKFALARARFEAGRGRLDAAARAVGLAGRFGAADLAILAVTTPTRARPAFFGFVPHLGGPHRARLDLLADDLAWVAGLEQPEVAEPAERRLHALWRKLWLGAITIDDPAIAALGPEAIAGTRGMLHVLER